MWKALVNEYRSNGSVGREWLEKSEFRYNSILSGVWFAAYVLDPKYAGENLTTSEWKMAQEFIETEFPEVVPSFSVIPQLCQSRKLQTETLYEISIAAWKNWWKVERRCFEVTMFGTQFSANRAWFQYNGPHADRAAKPTWPRESAKTFILPTIPERQLIVFWSENFPLYLFQAST